MSLYAIGDLHLHFQSELKAKNQIEDKIWQNHEAIFKENCNKVMTEDDTLVLVGDHSWGKNFAECEKDLEYICDLPGRKILLRGNHDMFWDAKKTDKLNEMFALEAYANSVIVCFFERKSQLLLKKIVAGSFRMLSIN